MTSIGLGIPMSESPIRKLGAVGVLAVNSPDYLRIMLANLDAGVISVPLRGTEDRERISRTDASQLVRPEAGAGWVESGFASSGGDRPAQVSFSSGTEGAPKAVLLSRENLHDVVTRISAVQEVTNEIREYIGVPVHHSFGYGRCRVVLNAGGALYIPGAGFNLSEIRQMLAAGEINALSAVPSQWRLFLQNLDMFDDTLRHVRWVEIGSQFMSADEKRALRQALPNAQIVQHYGLTEASRTTFQRIHSESDACLGSVGRAEGKVEVRISEAGRIEIKGPHVALGIDDGVTWQQFGADTWLTTTDTGRIEDGRLWFEGRVDDVINCAGLKLSPDVIESHVRRCLPRVGDFGILRRPDTLRGEGILIALSPGAAPDSDNIVGAVEDYIRGQGLDAASAIKMQVFDVLPRTETGKLQRQRLTAETDADNPRTGDPASKAGLAAVVDEIIGPRRRSRDVSFHELGGDSLLHMQFTLAIERALGSVPEGWEALPLSRILGMTNAAEALGPPVPTPGAPALPRGKNNMNPKDLSFWELVREDFYTNDANLFHQGFLMLFVHRFGNWRMDVRLRLLRAPLTLLYRFLNKLTQLFFGMKLDYTVKVGRRVKLEHFGGMILGAREIGNDVILRQNTTLGIRSVEDLNAKPTIGDFVDIGAGAVIVGNISVGENSVIGANSVVYMNVPPSSVVVGVPGRIIGKNPRQNQSSYGSSNE